LKGHQISKKGGKGRVTFYAIAKTYVTRIKEKNWTKWEVAVEAEESEGRCIRMSGKKKRNKRKGGNYSVSGKGMTSCGAC